MPLSSIASINAKIWFKKAGAIPQIEKKKRKKNPCLDRKRHSGITVLILFAAV